MSDSSNVEDFSKAQREKKKMYNKKYNEKKKTMEKKDLTEEEKKQLDEMVEERMKLFFLTQKKNQKVEEKQETLIEKPQEKIENKYISQETISTAKNLMRKVGELTLTSAVPFLTPILLSKLLIFISNKRPPPQPRQPIVQLPQSANTYQPPFIIPS